MEIVGVQQLTNHCIWAATEWFYTQNQSPVNLKPSPSIAWEKPGVLFFKVNCDASFDPLSKETGCAAICRDNTGQWREAITWKGYCQSALEAEIQGITIALEWIKNKGWRKCILATDCKQAIEEIQDQNSYQTRLTSLLIKCRQFLWQEEDITINFFEGRGANQVADVLAKETRRKIP